MVKIKRVLGIITILALLISSIPFFTNMSPALAQNGDNEGFSQGLANQLAVLYQQKAALTPVEQKIDSDILQAVQDVNNRISAGQTSNFQNLSTPLLKIDSAGNIEVKLTVTSQTDEQIKQLKDNGMTIERTLPKYRVIEGILPYNQIEAVAALDFVVDVGTPGYAVYDTGAVNSAGDTVLKAADARASFGVDGSGIEVGVMSDGVTHLADSVASGDLPSSPAVNVLQAGSGDEGTAMLEIVHDLAPGAPLAFYAPSTSTDMVTGIDALGTAGCKIIADDITFFDEPKFEDGPIAQEARAFYNAGGVYVTSAGNNAGRHYIHPYVRLAGTWPGGYTHIHNYGGGDVGNTFIVPNGQSIIVILQWNDLWGSAGDDFDLILARTDNGAPLATSLNVQNGNDDPWEGLGWTNSTGSSLSVDVVVPEWSLVSPPTSLVLDYTVYGGSGLQYDMPQDSLIGHSAVEEVLSSAATPAATPNTIESFSSHGPGTIYFPSSSSRQVPNITGVDGVQTETGLLGHFVNPFYGTSAAAPHVAAVAALVWDAKPTLTSSQVRSAIISSAVDKGATGFDYVWGNGLANAYAAVASVETGYQKLIGVDAGATAAGSYPGNYLFLYRFQAAATGNVVTFKFKAAGTGNVKVGIYADSSGAPGARLSAVNTSTPVVAGWNDITIASTAVTAGSYYWLAYVSDATIGYYQASGGTLRYKTTTYSTFTFPDPAGTGFTSASTNGLLAGWGLVAPPTAPTVTNGISASSILSTTARLNGEIMANGGEDPTVTIYWGPADGSTTPGSWAHNIPLGVKAVGTFYTDISSLTPSTPYYYRCYAENSGGGSWAGSTASFSTLAPPSAPTVTNSTGATSITDVGARLNGQITDNGGENPTVIIYWGPVDGLTTPGSWAHNIPLGVKAAGTFYSDISGLTASTPYYYRCYAENSGGGTWVGTSATFTTAATAQKLIGVDAGATAAGSYPGNYLFLYRFQAVASGNVVTFKIKTSGSGNVKVAIYVDIGGTPTALLNAVNTSTPVVAGWNSISITTTAVTAGSYYWLAYISDAAIGYYQSSGGTLRYKTATYSGFTFPNPAGTGFAALSTNGLLAGWGVVIPPSAPTVTNGISASIITSTGARLNGEITDNGGENPTVIIYWGPADQGTTAANWAHNIPLGVKPVGTFYTDISSLTPSTPYYYRCYAENSGGGSWAGSTASFSTLAPPSAPTVTNSTGATSITDTGARLNGQITDNGGENPTVIIYWGPADQGTTAANWAHNIPLGVKTVGTFYSDISGLTASTPYYYRCYAENSGGGTWVGTTATFTTAAAQVKLIGVDAGATATGSYPANYLFLYRFQAVASGNVVTFKIKTSGSGNVKVAIYADSSGAPGARLSAVNTSTPVVAGWNSISITTTAVTAGSYYWLAYISDTAIGYYQSTGGTLRYKAITYSTFTFPDPAGTGFASLTSNGLLAGWGLVVLPSPPSAPLLLSPGTAITFKWNTAVGATKYYLQVNTSSDFLGTNMFNAEVGSATSQEVTGLTLGVTYYWRVKAGNDGGWSDWSSVRSVIASEVP